MNKNKYKKDELLSIKEFIEETLNMTGGKRKPTPLDKLANRLNKEEKDANV